MNSSTQGERFARMIFPTPLNASVSLLKNASAAVRDFGSGSSFSHASVTIPSVPSEPMKMSRRLIPTEYFFSGNAPDTARPSASTAFSASTFSRVVPYLSARSPPALHAMFPPIDENLCEDGSGA